jgi:hypothetical protein
LAYDPALHSGCIRCRALEAAAATGSTSERRTTSPVVLVVGLVLTGAIGLLSYRAMRGVVLNGVDQSRAFNHPMSGGRACASQRCIPPAEKCFEDCPRSEGAVERTCAQACLGAFEPCVERCEPPVVMNAGHFAAVLDGPNNPQGLEETATALFEGATRFHEPVSDACMNSFDAAYLRIEVEGSSGTAREIQGLTRPRDGDDCLVQHLRHTRQPYPKGDDYVVYALVKP